MTRSTEHGLQLVQAAVEVFVLALHLTYTTQERKTRKSEGIVATYPAPNSGKHTEVI